MSGTLDQVLSALGLETIGRMAGQVGISPDQTQRAIGAALPLLLGAMARNAASKEGAQALHRAAVNDHAGNDPTALLGGLLGGGGASAAGGGALAAVLGVLGGTGDAGAARPSAPLADGFGILKHVLGVAQNRAANGVANAGGVSRSSATQLMAMLAPIVMAALGRGAQQKQTGPSGLAGMLGQELGRFGLGGGPAPAGGAAATARPPLGPIDRLLDTDGDGDVDVQDLMSRGASLFGTFTKR